MSFKSNKTKVNQLVKNFLKTAKKPLVVVVGATASGKTGLSIEIAKEFNGEIISADSRQIFCKLDIGTAKVTPKEMENIPHYGINLCEPAENFTVAEFKEYALEKIHAILQKNKIPILAGGTGLYVNAITQNFSLPQVPANWQLREKLEKLSKENLYAKLQKLDPQEAEKIHPNNKRYVIRAIEICTATQQKKSEIMQKQDSGFEVLILGIKLERELLYSRINQRVEQMFELGFLQEVKDLLKTGFDFKMQAFNSVGYPETKAYLDGKMTLHECKNLIKKNTRNYAKRQLTWWRKDKRVIWV